MKNKYTLLLLFAAFCCLNVQCKKESELDKLPPATTTGAQTMGCLINGDAFYTKETSQGNYLNGRIWIDANNQAPSGGKIMLLTRGLITKPGQYIITYNDPGKHVFSCTLDGEHYSSGYPQHGFAYMKITRLDSVRHYMAGEFSFTVYNRYYTKSVKITHGRFDFKYAP